MNQESKTRGEDPKGEAETRWTVMIYQAGDNNLTSDMAHTVEQIKSVADESSNVDLFVYFDGFSRNVPTLYCDFSETGGPVKYYRSIGIKDKLIRRFQDEDELLPNENSASMNNFLNFVHWCVSKDGKLTAEGTVDHRSEKKYALIISGHSFGFSNWALFKDENADYYMTLKKLQWLFDRITSTSSKLKKQAEKDIEKDRKHFGAKFREWSEETLKERTTEILGRPLDLLGFDSCEMSKLEIASQFHGLAKTMVASEGSIPNAGWNYAQLLMDRLNSPDSSDEKKIAAGFVESFIRQQNKYALADISVDMSAWDLGEPLIALEKSVAEMAGSLLECFEDPTSATASSMKRIITYAHWRCQTYSFEQNIDLGDFCSQIIDEIGQIGSESASRNLLEKVKTACENTLTQLGKCILLCGFSGGDFQYSHGVSLFFPWSWESYLATEDDYGELMFIEDVETGANWDQFLRTFLGPLTWRPAKAITSPGANSQFDPKTGMLVYKSYEFVDSSSGLTETEPIEGVRRPPNDAKRPPNDGKRPPNDGRRPPNDGKRPPNDGKRPPNDGKGLGAAISTGNMSAFFSRFMKMKNIGSSWNLAGFYSKSGRVSIDSETSVKPSLATVSSPMRITRPEPIGIHKSLNTLETSVAGESDDKIRDQLLKAIQDSTDPDANGGD